MTDFLPRARVDDIIPTDLLHGAHVDDAVPLRRHAQDLIQDLLHVQLLTLGKVQAVDDGCAVHTQVL